MSMEIPSRRMLYLRPFIPVKVNETDKSFIENILLTPKGAQAVNALQSIFHRFHPAEKIN